MKIPFKIGLLALSLYASVGAFAADQDQDDSMQPPSQASTSTSSQASAPSSAPSSTQTSTSSSTKLSASLAGTSGSGLAGKVWYVSSGSGGRIRATIYVPVDGQILADSNAAASAQFTLQLSDATCTLAVTGIDFAYDETSGTPTETAKYSLSLLESGTTVVATVGNCTASSGTTSGGTTSGGATSVFPVVTDGEAVSVVQGSGTSATPLLTGTFATVTPAAQPSGASATSSPTSTTATSSANLSGTSAPPSTTGTTTTPWARSSGRK